MEQYIGTKLNDRYELLSILGVGGMAVVYKAKDTRLNRMVAVKVLKPDLAADADIRRRFHDESRTVSIMNHGNIVNVYDVNQDGALDYFVMELVDGITLKQYIRKRGGVINWREALHFTVQIMEALSHAHSKGIIHRDIKPQNIMVLRDGSVKVTDFGIARIVDSAQQTMTKEALGSVHYISPEQAKGSAVDARSDIYSAGVALYEMITGRLPFEGESPVAVAVQHINSVALPPRDLNPEIPVGMEQITIKMMAPDRELRYASAEEVLADLEAFRRDSGIVFDYQFPWMAMKPREEVAAPDAETEKLKWQAQVQSMTQPEEPEQEEEEVQEDDGKRTALMIGVIIAAILLVLLFIFRMLFSSLIGDLLGGSTEYIIPNLLGKTYTEAQAAIFKDDEICGHFTVTISEETAYDATYEPGQIISQEPLGGSTTKSEKTEIIVVVCAEEEEEEKQLIMPHLIGQNYEDCADKLKDKYHAVVKYKSEFSSEYQEGLVIKTSPEEGAVLKEGQTVTLTYSKGPKSTTVTMISLIGMTQEEAESSLTEMGLVPGRVVTMESDKPAGTVIFQSVKSGSSVEKNTSVDLQISSGPRPEDRPVQPEDHEPEHPEPEPEHQPDDTLPQEEVHSITVTLPEGRTENATVVILVNGQRYYAGTVRADEEKVTVEYQGTVESANATVDGVETECEVK